MMTTQKSAHLAWCALVALALAKQDGSICSPAQENLFLCRWLATALKQRRFPREVTPDIRWLLQEGRQLGVRAKLTDRLRYLWHACSGELLKQDALFRLTFAVETAKSLQWVCQLLSDREWTGRHAVTFNPTVNAICLLRASLTTAFDEKGNQITQLTARITGDIQGLETLFSQCGWRITCSPDTATSHLYSLDQFARPH